MVHVYEPLQHNLININSVHRTTTSYNYVRRIAIYTNLIIFQSRLGSTKLSIDYQPTPCQIHVEYALPIVNSNSVNVTSCHYSI